MEQVIWLEKWQEKDNIYKGLWFVFYGLFCQITDSGCMYENVILQLEFKQYGSWWINKGENVDHSLLQPLSNKHVKYTGSSFPNVRMLLFLGWKWQKS